jgi:hypothetical protein
MKPLLSCPQNPREKAEIKKQREGDEDYLNDPFNHCDEHLGIPADQL